MAVPKQEEETGFPELTEKQKQEAEDRTSVSAVVVHEAVRLDGDEELERPSSALAWSGLAAGLLMGAGAGPQRQLARGHYLVGDQATNLQSSSGD